MGLSIWHLIVVLVIVLIIFGTKKIRNLGGDLGGAIKNFKTAIKDEEEQQAEAAPKKKSQQRLERPVRVIEGKATPAKATAKKKSSKKV